ncbi:MAG: type III pantothenate kinase, partial [Clostridia bacterium]|nr:type III pantothenate kinase [Clostridia bacterium]
MKIFLAIVLSFWYNSLEREVSILILTIDIGNTNIKFVSFDGEKMVSSRRVSTERRCTSDEYGIIIKELLS